MRFQGSNNYLITVGTNSVQILPNITGGLRRTQIIITNVSTGSQIITVAKQENPAKNNLGIPINIREHYCEATDSGYLCYQGAIQAISTAVSGQLAITESFIEVER